MPPSLEQVLLRVGLPLAAALLGALFGAFGGGQSRMATALVVHFAAGAFLALALLHLLPESGQQAGWTAALLAAAAGWSVCAVLTRRTGAVCPGCAAGHEHAAQLTYSASLMAVVGVHSALDGVALATAPSSAHSGDLLSLAVLVHKIPEGMALAAVCRSAGRSAGAAVIITALIQAATVLGYAVGALVLLRSGLFLGLGLGAVAGSLLYLVGVTFRSERQAEHPLWNLGLAAVGALLVVIPHLLGAGH